MSDASPPQAGWYADPENPSGERWWNGSGWSDEKRSATTPARPDPYAHPAPAYGAAPLAPYGAAPSPTATNGLAVAGLITSLAGIIFSFAAIVGIVLSILGLIEARKREAAGNPNTGKGLAIAGLVTGIVIVAIGVLFVIAYFAFLVNVGYPY